MVATSPTANGYLNRKYLATKWIKKYIERD